MGHQCHEKENAKKKTLSGEEKGKETEGKGGRGIKNTTDSTKKS